MFKESNLFSNVEGSTPRMKYSFKELLKSLECFASSMYCEELVYDVVDEQTMMESLVYLWQQNSKRFNKNIPSDLKEFFLSKFTKSEQVYYRGLHSLNKGKLDVSKFDKLEFASCTDSKDIAASFAVGWRSCFLDRGEECYVYEVTGDLALKNVNEYRDMGEEEVIVYNPVYSKVPLFKVLECNYKGVERLPNLGDMKIEEINTST